MSDCKDCINVKLSGGIATVEINRIQAHNAINNALLLNLKSIMDRLKSDRNIHVVIITGAGDKSFCAGADIKEMKGLDQRGAIQLAQTGHAVMNSIAGLDKTSIAVINGLALGGGFELALSCDIRYAAKGALLGFPEVKLGLIPGFGGTQRLTREIGKSMALEMILSGETVDSDRALQMGLVNGIFPSESLMPHALDVASKILAAAPLARRRARNLIKNGLDMSLAVALEEEAEAFAELLCAPEAKEGINSFINKRSADFSDI